VRDHHVARPPLAQSGLGAVPVDEDTFQGSHPHACASQDRMDDTNRACVSWEVQERKALRRAAMEGDSGKAGQRVCQRSEGRCQLDTGKGVEEGEGGTCRFFNS